MMILFISIVFVVWNLGHIWANEIIIHYYRLRPSAVLPYSNMRVSPEYLTIQTLKQSDALGESISGKTRGKHKSIKSFNIERVWRSLRGPRCIRYGGDVLVRSHTYGLGFIQKPFSFNKNSKWFPESND